MEALREEDYQEVVELDTQVFCEQNPVLKFLGVSPSAWHDVEAYDTQGCLSSGLSLVARDLEADGKIVAFLMATHHDLRKPPPDFTSALKDSPSLGKFFEFDGRVRWPGMFHEGYRHAAWFVGRSCRVAAGGTRAGYEGLGLGARLRARVVELARAKGYDVITVETIHSATQHIWSERLGFQVLSRAVFQDFRSHDGSAPFKDMPGDTIEMTVQQKVLRSRPLRDARIWAHGLGIALAIAGNKSDPWKAALARVFLGSYACFLTILGTLWSYSA